jgi:hypothetical protein
VLERSRSIQFNSAQFNWIGSTSSSNSTVYVWHTSGIKSVEEATKRTVVMGGTGAGSYTVIYPTVMNSLIGTRFKVVTGYQSGRVGPRWSAGRSKAAPATTSTASRPRTASGCAPARST